MEKDKYVEHRGPLQGSEMTLCNTKMVNACQYTSVQTHRMDNTKNGPQYRLWTLGDNDVSMRVHQCEGC